MLREPRGSEEGKKEKAAVLIDLTVDRSDSSDTSTVHIDDHKKERESAVVTTTVTTTKHLLFLIIIIIIIIIISLP